MPGRIDHLLRGTIGHGADIKVIADQMEKRLTANEGTCQAEGVAILPWIAPGVLIGFPLGHWMIGRVSPDHFRRVCMSFDAYLVSFGLSRVLVDAVGLAPLLAYQVR